MRKRIATFLMVAVSVITVAGIAQAAIHDPMRDRRCFDQKVIPKECDTTVCTCLFHEIEEYVMSIFSSK